MPIPKVVIVGRPNVGKSSLFNWIAGRRIAIVDDVAGVTRDRVSTLGQVDSEEGPRYFDLIDTGGVGMVDRDDLDDDVDHQIETALNEADLILFVVDVREGRMPLDEEVAQRLRYLTTPVILVVNKADEPELDGRGEEFYKLGRGKPVYVSTRHNRNKSALMDLIARKLPADDGQRPADEVMKVAVVGRPNTGKSTFINTLAQADRMIVSERPGTTRDSVDVRFELDGLPFLAIDTAGVKRKAKIHDDLDYYSIHRAERSIRRADIVLLFLDPTQGISRLDKQLADYIAKQYKPCIFTVNKWDLILGGADVKSTAMMRKYAASVQHSFRSMSYMPLAFITGKTGKNVKSLLNLAQSMFKQAQKRVSTGTLNRVVREAVEAHPPALRENKTPKLYYATQAATNPPTIVLFVNRPSLFDPTYQRYLLNVFRSKLPFRDIPIKLYLRSRTQSDIKHFKDDEPEPEPAVESAPAAEVSRPTVPNPPPETGETASVSAIDRDINDLLSELGD